VLGCCLPKYHRVREDDDDRSPMQRFEDLAKRLFSIAKDDVKKVEREAEELAADVVKPAEPEPGE
jgi:hypothetical protein